MQLTNKRHLIAAKTQASLLKELISSGAKEDWQAKMWKTQLKNWQELIDAYEEEGTKQVLS